MDYIVEMVGIRKEFPGILANDDIHLGLKKGEIHALLGENGAGKSTLMSILFGLYQPDGGKIRIRGKDVHISNPNIANDLGIGMVHQHFKLVHNFTVTQNIILGREPKKNGSLDLLGASRRIQSLSEKYGLNVDPQAKIEDISVGMQQRVEILKMLYRDAEVLILDEPTAVLTPQEIKDLMGILKNLINEGKSIILITHKLKEIKMVADRCTVIRRGKVIGTVEVHNSTESQMAEMMVGRSVTFRVAKKEQVPGKELLTIKNLSALSSRKIPALTNFSLSLHEGEILGIAGVEGNGQTELIEVLTGLRSQTSGSIILNGMELSNKKVKPRIDHGLGHIPEDRHRRGLVLDFPIGDNLVLKRYLQNPFSTFGFLNPREILKYAQKIMEQFDVRSGKGPGSIARELSGGNQQKAIVGREIDADPSVLIAAQPTRGLDVGSIEYIHKRLVEHRDRGRAVLLVSLELDEIISLSDRIAVISKGELMGIFKPDEIDEQRLGLMMAGYRKEESA